jgi:hypothetical protein
LLEAAIGEIRTTTYSSIVDTNAAKKNKKVVLPINNNELNVVAACKQLMIDNERNERIIHNTELLQNLHKE